MILRLTENIYQSEEVLLILNSEEWKEFKSLDTIETEHETTEIVYDSEPEGGLRKHLTKTLNFPNSGKHKPLAGAMLIHSSFLHTH